MTIQSRVEDAVPDAATTTSALAKPVMAVALMALGLTTAALVSLRAGGDIALLLALGSIGVAAVYVGLRNPVWSLVFLLVTMFLRIPLTNRLPMDPFLIAFAGLVISAGIWLAGNPEGRPKLGATEVMMTLFIAWNVNSILWPHDLPALANSAFEEQLPLARYFIISTVIPFVVYYISRAIFTNLKNIRILLIILLIIGAYSAVVSILQFTGPHSLVWPEYILHPANTFAGRASGVADQPNANGLALITGYAVAVILATTIDHPRWRTLLWVIAAACGYGVYLTHTRAVYLAFVLVVIMGALLAEGYRRAFVTTGVVLIIGITLAWSTFTSADRDAGGVSSTLEVYDRLNADITAIWGFLERPWFGWGLGRFLSLNTYHHQRWSEDIPWIRGLGIAAHSNELGILAELGIVGLALWLGVLFFVFRGLVKGVRTLPAAGLSGRPLALTALMSLSALVMVGLFIDLRLLDYSSTAAFAFAGAAVGALDRFQNASNTRQYVRLPRLRF